MPPTDTGVIVTVVVADAEQPLDEAVSVYTVVVVGLATGFCEVVELNAVDGVQE